ncbi:hypothetical protein AAMO2058_001278400 [Amorphochlora amoebiformis]
MIFLAFVVLASAAEGADVRKRVAGNGEHRQGGGIATLPVEARADKFSLGCVSMKHHLAFNSSVKWYIKTINDDILSLRPEGLKRRIDYSGRRHVVLRQKIQKNLDDGFRLSRSALVLAAFIHSHSTCFVGHRVLEIGSGSQGLGGLAASHYARQVVFTDQLDNKLMRYLELNAESNAQTGITLEFIDWHFNRTFLDTTFNIIIASDVDVNTVSADYAAKTIIHHLRPGGLVILVSLPGDGLELMKQHLLKWCDIRPSSTQTVHLRSTRGGSESDPMMVHDPVGEITSQHQVTVMRRMRQEEAH